MLCKGELIDVEIDNTTSYIEFSGDSKVEVAKILRELGSNILKIGNDAVEVKSEKGGIRNYTDMSDGSSIVLESTMFLKIFYLCNFANYMGNKNPFVIEIEFYIKQLPQKFLLKPMNM